MVLTHTFALKQVSTLLMNKEYQHPKSNLMMFPGEEMDSKTVTKAQLV